MLLNRETRQGIREGRISLVFRRWKRPTVKAGGSLLTPIGELGIRNVRIVDIDRITAPEAQAAGFADLDSLRAYLSERTEGDVYRVELGGLSADPRTVLRDTLPTDGEVAEILDRLARMDSRSSSGSWTRATLEAIDERPAVRAGDLAVGFPRELRHFKANVRKLKSLGLTESLEVGYRLSPRGEHVLAALRR